MCDRIATVKRVIDSNLSLPDSRELVETLLELEKDARQEKKPHSLRDLEGSWKLRFITGTKKTRKRAGVVLGAGRYIPKGINITIDYQQNSPSSENAGKVKNTVRLGFISLSLSGPIEFMPKRNILAFDFTYLDIMLFGSKLYSGYLKGGLAKDTEFHATPLKNRAFFSYFLLHQEAIAARGKGGGLALWTRDKD